MDERERDELRSDDEQADAAEVEELIEEGLGAAKDEEGGADVI